jgi:hypothetical protein
VSRAEFDVWIEQHYTELLKVARKRTNSDDEARDALQGAITSMLASTPFMAAPIEYAWPRAVKFVTSAARNDRVGRASVKRLRGEVYQINRAASRLHGWKRPAPRAE